jgi:formylglycine-generating enzyme required for sulfatase activity
VPPQIQIIVTGFLLIVAIVLPDLLRRLTAQRAAVPETVTQARRSRGLLPWALLVGALVVVVVVGFLLLRPGETPTPVAGSTPDQTGTTAPVLVATATPVVLKPTNTPVPAPPSPTPRPTPTLAPTPTPAPTKAGEPTLEPTVTQVPRPDVEMVEIPAGSFIMGDDGTDPNEAPAHVVVMPTYYIDRFEVTNADFAMFVDATGYLTEGEMREDKKTWRTYSEGKENHPVVKVTFRDAQAFCEWMGKRLPTEEEWEKAARGTDERDFPWGDMWDTTRANVKVAGLRSTAAVGSFSGGASPYGVGDLAGNVWEWTNSPYLAYPGSTFQDPQYSDEARVTRGGGWFDDQKQVSTTNRSAALPQTANDDLGFRCVADSG